MAYRTHAQIIVDAGGNTAFAEALGGAADANQVNQWKRGAEGRGSIPAPYWLKAVDAGLTTLEELANAAEQLSRAGKSAA